MTSIYLGGVVYTAVKEIDGHLIDGNSREDVTGGMILGTHIGTQYHNDGRYEYYRNGRQIYQFTPDNEYIWFCDATAEEAMNELFR